MNIDLGIGKSAQAAADKSLSLYSGEDLIYLNPIEAQKLKNWLNEVI